MNFSLQEFYSEINAATLTGAIDVIVVEQEDGTLVSSPFHVRYYLNNSERPVDALAVKKSEKHILLTD